MKSIAFREYYRYPLTQPEPQERKGGVCRSSKLFGLRFTLGPERIECKFRYGWYAPVFGNNGNT